MILSPTDADDSSSDLDSAFRLLADGRRQRVLRYLDEDATPTSLAELADRLALEKRTAANADAGTISSHGPVSTDARRRIELSLRHTHVPMLADAGAVAFGPSENTVALTDEGRALVARSSAIRGPDDTASTTHTTVR